MPINWSEVGSTEPVKTLIRIVLLLLLLFLLLSMVFSVLTFENRGDLQDEARIFLSAGSSVFFVEVAESDKERMTGLSGRNNLTDDGGMLFVFNDGRKHGIWMKEMNFPIDILWINRELEVVYIKERVSPDTYPRIFASPTESNYVLELKAGSIERADIFVGSVLDFSI